jgi:hypothetical protein
VRWGKERQVVCVSLLVSWLLLSFCAPGCGVDFLGEVIEITLSLVGSQVWASLVSGVTWEFIWRFLCSFLAWVHWSSFPLSHCAVNSGIDNKGTLYTMDSCEVTNLLVIDAVHHSMYNLRFCKNAMIFTEYVMVFVIGSWVVRPKGKFYSGKSVAYGHTNIRTYNRCRPVIMSEFVWIVRFCFLHRGGREPLTSSISTWRFMAW